MLEETPRTSPTERAFSIIRFGAYQLDLCSAELRKKDVRIRLQEQPFQILVALLERPGEVVLREEIRQKLWPDDTVVEFDHSINAAVKRLRDALNETAEKPRYIETLARRGYRFIAPVSRDPVAVPSHSPASAQAPQLEAQAEPVAPIRWRPRRIAMLVAAVVALAVALTALLIRRVDKSSPVDLHVAPLTSSIGLELQPSFSPDGTRIAYAWSAPPQKQPSIYVKLNGPGDAIKMSKDLPRVFSPAWSPDGRWIAALQDLGQFGVIVLIPASGGQFKVVTRLRKAEPGADACVSSPFPFICGQNSFGSALAWSRDGKYLFTSAETTLGSPAAIVRVSAETGEVQAVTLPPNESAGDFGPAVSSDGKQLAFARLRSIRTGDLYVVPLAEGNSSGRPVPRRVTTDAADIVTPAWTPDSRELIFSSNRAGGRELWRVPATGGKPVRLSGIGEDALDVALSQNGRTLVYNRGHYAGSLWKIPISGGKGGEPIRVTATTTRDKFSQFSPDGKRIAFESGRSGVDEIWVCDADGANAVQLTSFARGISGSPRWSPDGRMIAFDSNVAGDFGVYVIPSEGGRPLHLTQNSSSNAVPNWSRDGAWIYFTSWRTGRAEVWKIRASGGSETQVTREGGGLAVESTDGRDLYFIRGDEDRGDLFRMPREGGKATKVLSSMSGRMFTLFPKGLYFATGSPHVELRYLEFETGAVRTISPLPGMPHADVSSDERWALYPQPSMSDTNLFVVENFR